MSPPASSTAAVVPRGSGRLVLGVAVARTVFIALGAFWLSFTSLSALARACGIPAGRAWMWPLIVDGVIVVATVSVVAMSSSGQDRRAVRYPWLLLSAGAAVSVLANASHAIMTADARVPSVLAALVAAVPPVVLVAITHLTVELTRRPHPRPTSTAGTPRRTAQRPAKPARTTTPVDGNGPVGEALRLRAQTQLTNREIAARLGVHPSTVGRWLKSDHAPPLPPAAAPLELPGGTQNETSEEKETTMNTDHDRQQADHSKQHNHDRLAGAESPRELLAIHDPSGQATARGRQAAGRGHGVTVQWVRPTELAARIAARSAAGAVAAHVAAHRQVRENVRARLAPLSAFGRQAESGPVTVERSVVGR